MDYLDFESILNLSDINKKKTIEQMNQISFDFDQLNNQSDILLQMLDYSPKIKSKNLEKLKFKPMIKIEQLSDLKKIEPLSPTKEKCMRLLLNKKYHPPPPKLSQQDKIEICKSLVSEIINKILGKIRDDDSSSVNSIDSGIFEAKTEKKNEESEFKLSDIKKNSNDFTDDNNLNTEVYSPLMINSTQETIKIYLMNTEKNIDVNISKNDTVNSTKIKIIQIIKEKNIIELHSQNPYDYVLRLTDDDDFKADMDLPPLENSTNIYDMKIKTLVFISIKKNKSNRKIEEVNEENFDSNKELPNPQKKNIKVNFKENIGVIDFKNILINEEDSLKELLNNISNMNLLKYKNFNSYYFLRHDDKNDLINAININTKIKYLEEPYEIDLYYNSKENNEDKNNGFYFNEISAGLYQEFEVIKINKYNQRRERILGIDMYKIYNNLPKKKNGGLLNKIFKETKNPVRLIKNVKECKVKGNNSFYIDIKDEESDKIKKFTYEVKNNNIRDEIVAKLNFLINLNQDNNY